MTKCPTCGHPVSGISIKMLNSARFQPQERLIVAELVSYYPKQVTLEHLVHVLYSDREDGGADTAYMVVRTRISQLRKKVRPLGWQIPKNGVGSSGRYHIEKIEAHS